MTNRAGRLRDQIVHMLRKAEVDRAVLYSVLGTLRGLFFGPVTGVLVVTFFTPVVQGYYYTFGSLTALQVLVELGLGQVILQFASYEWASLGLDEHGHVTGEVTAHSRLASLLRQAVRWYLVASVILLFGLGIAGYAFFRSSPQTGTHWVQPWFFLCLLSGLRLLLLPVFSILEGCGQIRHVSLYRLSEGFVSTFATWIAIVASADLWCPVVGVLCALLASLIFLSRYRTFFSSLRTSPDGPQMDWWLEIWPMQWRIAVSFGGGYFLYSLFVPVLFRYHGPAVAGQMGMSWSIFAALSSVSTSWIAAKVPTMGQLIAHRRYAELDRLYSRVSVMAFAVATLGAVVVWALTAYLYESYPRFGQRLLPPLPTALFLLATVLMQITYPQSTYLRAHKREPMLVLSVGMSSVTGIATVLFGKPFGAVGVAASYLAVAVVAVPLSTLIFVRCRAAWHKEQ